MKTRCPVFLMGRGLLTALFPGWTCTSEQQVNRDDVGARKPDTKILLQPASCCQGGDPYEREIGCLQCHPSIETSRGPISEMFVAIRVHARGSNTNNRCVACNGVNAAVLQDNRPGMKSLPGDRTEGPHRHVPLLQGPSRPKRLLSGSGKPPDQHMRDRSGLRSNHCSSRRITWLIRQLQTAYPLGG